MKKYLVIALALALTAGAAYANYCARDYVPAATLLVPYAVQDMNGSTPSEDGYQTLLSVTNVSSERQLIHVTVWSPLSEPIVDFDEILSGYDVWQINFRHMLEGHFDAFDTEGVNGFWSATNPAKPAEPYGPTTNYPYSTAMPAPQDTDDPSDLDAADGCYFPYGYHPEYGAGIIAGLRADIFAVELQITCTSYFINNVPWQIILTDDPLFFYVTVDAVDACSLNFPNSDAYWAGGTIPDEDNVLIGEIYYLNTADNFSEAMPAVHLEYDADAVDGPLYTFYELATDTDGAYDYDGLEPLATAFAFRYFNSGGVSSDLMVWKSHYEFYEDGGVVYPYAYACGPYIYYAWDMNEKSKARGFGPSGFDTPEPNVIPFETQKVPLTVANWTGLMSGNGWMLLVFDPSIYDVPTEGLWWWTEAWVGVTHNFGSFSAGLEAATMANYWCFPQQQMGTGSPFYLGVNFDYTDYDVPVYYY